MNHSTHATRHKKADTIVTHIVLIAVCIWMKHSLPDFAAGSVFIAVPIVILYFALSNFLVAGVSAGAVKE